MSEQTSTNKETKLFLGRYEILSEVGHGGMGRVYKVKDVRLDRIVALKVLLKSLTLNEENIQRFMREAKSNAALRHPNIVTLYDFGKVKETVYLTMDFIEGGSLEDFLKREKPSFEFSCKILLKLLDAIGYAHGKNIIHRDIKPSNILLQGENPFITDFGLAKAVHDSINLSQSGAILGTPSYMAPEQAQGMKENPVDQQSDIYSLGATFYQMLTGKLPIEGETVFQIMYKLASEIPPKPCDICPEIPLTLSEICLKALEKDKKSRYQTTEEMAKAIQHYLEGSTPSEKKLLQEKRPFEKTHFRKNLPEQKTTLIDKNRTIPAMEKPSKAKPGKGKERKKTSHNSEIKLSLFLILGAAIVVVLLIFVISINKKNTKPYPIVSENTRPEEPKHPVIEKRPEEPKHPVIEKRPEEPKHPVIEKRPEEPKHPVIEKRPEEPKHPVIEKRPEEPKHPVIEKRPEEHRPPFKEPPEEHRPPLEENSKIFNPKNKKQKPYLEDREIPIWDIKGKIVNIIKKIDYYFDTYDQNQDGYIDLKEKEALLFDFDRLKNLLNAPRRKHLLEKHSIFKKLIGSEKISHKQIKDFLENIEKEK